MEAGSDMEIWRQAAALSLVFLLLGAAAWALRRRAGGVRTGAAKTLKAVERIALTPQHAVHLIRTTGRELLLVTHPQGCSLLCEQTLQDQTCESPKAMESARPSVPPRAAERQISRLAVSEREQEPA